MVFSKEEYIALCQKMLDEQYGNDEDDYDTVDMNAWIPSESEAKEKMIAASINGIIDLTKTKKSDIATNLFKCTNLKIGNFSIKITRYSGSPSKDGVGLTFDISIFEETSKTPSGNPCKMTYKVDILKDSRFTGRQWISYFNKYNGSNIPTSVLVDIIRFLQVVHRLPAFV